MKKASFELKGLDEIQRSLKKISKEIGSLENQQVTFDDLFPPSFIQKYTNFQTIQDLVEKSPFKVESQEDFERIPDNEWDKYIQDTTSFQSWDEMMTKAGEEFLGMQMKQIFKKHSKK